MRRQILAGAEAGADRSVFEREGMKAWIETEGYVVAPSFAGTSPPQSTGGCERTEADRKQMVAVLAGMLVGQRKGAGDEYRSA